MDENAILKIERLVQAAAPIVKAPDFERTGRFYVREADGGLIDDRAPITEPDARLYDTDSLARLIAHEENAEHEVDVYFSSKRITALVHDADHKLFRQHAIILEHHPAFARVQKLATTTEFTQKTLIRLLRAEFNGHVDDAVIERFRSLKLKTDGEGSTVVAQGREAVDRRIQQKISDEKGEQIPTEIEVTIPVYDLDEARDTLYEVGILVDVSPDDDGRPVFELTTILNDLRGAERSALDQLVETLTKALPDGVPVYYGSV